MRISLDDMTQQVLAGFFQESVVAYSGSLVIQHVSNALE
jgi:hypothetical protein